MSVHPVTDPTCRSCPSTRAITTIIDARPRDIGELRVRRILPSVARRMVGPFIFLDHMGPVALPPGRGFDVPPHPHIGLATVTYLFEGEIEHRDSLGSHQPIQPGALNWMTAGRGIVHSERTGSEERARGPHVHGIQLWVALPLEHEETAPRFHHHPADTLPVLQRDGSTVRVLAGTAYGVTAPVPTLSPLSYAEVRMDPGSRIAVPAEHHERAAYVVEGSLSCGPETAETGRMLVFSKGARVTLEAHTETRVMLLGGAPLEGKRHIWWNFVSSRPERLEQAKLDWQQGRFPLVPGDEEESIPAPER
jgi:redox-sensitive bicupin YhaK (pirin superfamily)